MKIQAAGAESKTDGDDEEVQRVLPNTLIC